VKITYADTSYTQFTYNGAGERVKIQEYDNTGSHNLTSTKQYVWAGGLAEERDATNTVTKRYFGQGEQRVVGGTTTNYFYTRDHLGSIREMIDSSGAIQARYSYDPYGRATKVSGSLDCDFGFTGYYVHATSGLLLSATRAYDPNQGRFIERDPSGEGSGLNLYAYCGDSPINNIDPLGLTYESNNAFFWDWITGGGATSRSYGPNDVETQEMMSSPGAAKMRADAANGATKGNYDTIPAYVQTILDPSADHGSTAVQVGGFVYTIQNNADGTVTYTIKNDAGTHSFFLHAVPNMPDTIPGTNIPTPMRTIHQTFTWTEPGPGGGSNPNGSSSGCVDDPPPDPGAGPD
jgi:RHS repeat-associated protein